MPEDFNPGGGKVRSSRDGIDPCRDLPLRTLLAQPAAHEAVRDAAIVEDVSDLGGAEGLAVGKPFAGHHAAVGHRVDPAVVDGSREADL